MYKFYSVVAVLSTLVRQFLLPNPFDPLGETFTLTVNSVSIPLTPEVANWIAEPLLHIVTFSIVGIYYRKGKHEPAIGSFLYLFLYAAHVGLIYLISVFGFTWVAMIIVLVLYVAAHIGINVLRNRFAT